MERLPPVEEQEWMLDCLRMLVRRKGAARLLEAPLLLPRKADLGPWEPTPAAVGAMMERMLRHLGLDALTVRVVPSGTAGLDQPVAGQRGSAVWLGGLADGTAWFGCEPSLLPRRVGEAGGALTLPATHLWRRHEGLELDDPVTEDRLCELTAVYLGLGVPLANHVATMGGAGPGEARIGGPGALGHAGPGFLLAAQVLSRRMGCLQTCNVGRMLDHGPRRVFADGLRHLRRLPGGVAWRLRLPGQTGPAPDRLPRRDRKVAPARSPVDEVVRAPQDRTRD